MKGTKKRNRRGDGTVYQLSSTGKWVGQYIKDGKRKSITGNSKEEVSDKLRKILVEIKENRYIEKDNKTIGEILEEILQNKEHDHKRAESTKLRDRETANVIFKSSIGNMPIQKVKRQDLQNFFNDIAEEYYNSYIDKIHIHLSAVYKIATIDHLITENFFAIGAINKTTSKREDKKVDALTREEQKDFMKQLEKEDYKYKDIFYVLFETGMRIGEVLALERANIDIKNGIIHVRRTLTRDKNDRPILSNKTKTYAGIRDVPMTEHLKEIFKANMNIRFLFTKPDGGFISTTTINTAFKKIAKDAGIRVIYTSIKRGKKIINHKTSTVSTHQIRHSFATRCAEQGMNIKALQAIMGHSDYTITENIYVSADTNFTSNEMKKVEEELKVANLI